jgi:hypothetical protein
MRDAAKNWPHAFADAANQNPPKKSQQEAKADLVQELSRTQPQLFSIYKGTPGPYSLGLRDITDNLVTLFESGDKALIWAGTGKDYFAISRTTPGDQTDSFEVKDAKTLASVSEASGMVVGGQGNAFFVIVDYQAIYVYRSDDPSVLIVPGSQLSGRESYDRGGGFGGHIIAEDNITYEPITDISNLSISTYDTTRDAINDTNTQVIHRKMRDLNFPLNPDQFPNYYRLPQ